MEHAGAAADAEARFPGMDGLLPGGQLPDPEVPAEIRVLMNTPFAAWTDDDWRTAGWVRITDPEVARNTGVRMGSYVPSMPGRELGADEPHHLEEEWLQLGWTRLRVDPMDPRSPLELAPDGMEIWVPPGPVEWADCQKYARFAPPGGVPASVRRPPPAQPQYPQPHPAYAAQTYANPQSPPGWNGWGSPMPQSPAYGGMSFLPPGPPMGWGGATPPPPMMGGQNEELIAARRQLEEMAAKEKAAQAQKIEELTKQLNSLMGKLTIQQQTIDTLRAPGERAGMQPAGAGSPAAPTPSAGFGAGAYGVGISSRVQDADSCRRQLFGAPMGVGQPITRELKELFLKYHVADAI